MRIVKFIALWLGLSLFFSLLNNSAQPSEVLIQSVNSLLYTAGFYVSYFLLVQRFLYKRQTLKFILLYLLLTAILSFTSMMSMYQVYVYQQRKFFIENFWKDIVFFTSNYMLVTLVVSSMLSIRFLKDKRDTQKQLENLEKEKISTELSFLKAQINPHFLFNSLNNILFQIDKTNKDARETLLKFSEMLRYQLYECSSDLIDIEKEIQYIRNYIEIQMLRKTEKYECNVSFSAAVKNFKIAPLLLIPFIENAFKHISNHANGKNAITIAADYQQDEFIFCIKNDKDQLTPANIKENKGIGLTNVKRRLDLLYENRHTLEITNDAKVFNVNMRIRIS
jgi:two-component system LytT family sensor kinase